MSYNQDQANIFLEAGKYWNLEELYAVLEKIKQRMEQKPLTLLERAILRGILAGKSPEEITHVLPSTFSGLIVNSTQRLYRYIQTLTGTEIRDVHNYQNIPKLLEAAGYKQLPLPDPLEPSTEQTLQGGRQSLSTISSVPKTLIAEPRILNSTTTIVPTNTVSQPILSEQSNSNLHSNTVLIEKEKDQNIVSTKITPSLPQEIASKTESTVLSDA